MWRRFLRALVILAVATPGLAQSVRVEPDVGVAGHFGTWTITYQVGEGGIAPGGGVRVQLPDAWHAGERNSANRLQATDPMGDHYVSARSSRSSVRLSTEVESEAATYLVKSPRRGLDGRMERYVFVVRVTVSEGELVEGDTLRIIYGDTSGGSRGMKAAVISTEPEPVLVAVDPTGSGRFELLQNPPTLVARSGIASELTITGPSTLVVGEPAELRIAVVDALANPAAFFEDDVELRVIDGDVRLATTVTLPRGHGYHRVAFTPQEEGIVRIRASTRDRLLTATSNPMRAHRERPRHQIYWGDLHSHTRHSWDGVGDGAFEYARHVAGLDFYAVTDHSRSAEDGYPRGLGPEVWKEYTDAVDAHHEPGTFVTLHAYEASFRAPYGHHNVYFRAEPGPLLSPERITLPELWAAMRAGEALTIPHHTGKFPQPVSFEHHDPEFRRNFEIYSAHGLSEAYDPSHPLAFEQSDFTSASTSAENGVFAQDAWKQGLVLSTIAASDDHRAHPGQPHWGLAAVSAPSLTRASIFDALYAHRTYGTTGVRILLDFRANEASMGEETSSETPPRLRVEAHGTDRIAWVEILRYSKADGGFVVAHRFEPDTSDFEWLGVDEGFRDDSIYYVRLRQRGTVRGRVAMAWSSPIWVEKVP